MHHKNSSTNQDYEAKQRKHGQNIYHPNNGFAEHGLLEIYVMLIQGSMLKLKMHAVWLATPSKYAVGLVLKEKWGKSWKGSCFMVPTYHFINTVCGSGENGEKLGQFISSKI